MNDMPGHKWQWNGYDPTGEVPDPAMMFNTDFELFFDLDLDDDGQTLCDLQVDCIAMGTCGTNNVCRVSDTYALAEHYITVSLIEAKSCRVVSR